MAAATTRIRSRSSTETFSNPTSIKSGNFDLDFKIETSGGDNPGTLEVKLGGSFQSQADRAVPAVRLRRLAHGGERLADLLGQRRSDLDRRSGVRQLSRAPSTRCRSSSTTSSPPPTRSSRARAAPASRQGLLQRLGINLANWLTDLKNEGTEDVEGPADDPHLRHGERPSDRRGPEDDRREGRERRSATSTSPSSTSSTTSFSPGTSTSIPGENDKLLRRLQVSFDLKPPAGHPRGARLAHDRPAAQPRRRQQAADDPGARERAAAQRTCSSSSGSTRGQLGGALRGGLGTSGALPESGGSTTAPSTSADPGVRAVPLPGIGQRGAAAVRRPARPVAA